MPPKLSPTVHQLPRNRPPAFLQAGAKIFTRTLGGRTVSPRNLLSRGGYYITIAGEPGSATLEPFLPYRGPIDVTSKAVARRSKRSPRWIYRDACDAWARASDPQEPLHIWREESRRTRCTIYLRLCTRVRLGQRAVSRASIISPDAFRPTDEYMPRYDSSHRGELCAELFTAAN